MEGKEEIEEIKREEGEEEELSKELEKVMTMGGNHSKIGNKKWEFWDTQPVVKIDESSVVKRDAGAIEVKTLADVRKEPYSLPEGYEWCDLDINDDNVGKEFYDLLVENYVEDDENMFRFDYSIDFLRWNLCPPGFYKDWFAGVRVSKNKKLVACITGIPVRVMIEGQRVKMAEINFLCVHKKLRTLRLAPVLIKEITRRVNLKKIWQAVYTAGVVIPTPIARTRYFHRSLNPKKLIEVRFSGLGPNQTIARLVKLYRLPEQPHNKNFRAMTNKDVSKVHKLLTDYLPKTSLSLHLTEEDVKHMFLPRPDIIFTYVVEEDKKVTDFGSFYSLPSSILKHEKHKTLRAAYSFYNVTTSMSMEDLMKDVLIMANNEGFDVFNALDIMDNKPIFEALKFAPGDGNLQYYLFNWATSREFNSEEIGIVLV